MKPMLTFLSFLLTVNLAISEEIESKVKLPSTKPSIVMPLLKAFDSDKNFQYILNTLGIKYTDVGSGISVLLYKLDDGNTITVGTSD